MKPCFVLQLVACLCFSSCASDETAKPAEEATKSVEEGPKLVGRIASIPADKRFVLIQSYGKWEMEAGAILTTRGPEDRTANLRTTGEKLGEFAAADLQSGMVKQGDAVYSQHVPKPSTAALIPEQTQNQEQAPVENVQKNN
jgi:hypothetical protein